MAAKSTTSELSNKGKFKIWIKIYVFVNINIILDKSTRSGSKTDRELVHQISRDNSQITCFFKACDREASEKLLRDAYVNSIDFIIIYLFFILYRFFLFWII